MATVTRVCTRLNTKKNKRFHIALEGTGFVQNTTEVVINFPATGAPTHQWKGKAKRVTGGGTFGVFHLKQEKDEKKEDRPLDDTADVSITIDATTIPAKVDLYEEDADHP